MKTMMSSSRFFLPVPEMRRKGMLLPNKILLVLVVCLLTLMGCVESEEPVGETPISIKAQEWEGTWISLDRKTDTVALQVVDASKGVLLMEKSWLEMSWFDGKEKRVHSITSLLYLRKSGNLLFASWREHFEDNTFWWGLIGNWALEDGRRVILFWLPDWEKVNPMISRGELPGSSMERKTGPECLGQLSPKHYRVLRDREKEIFIGPAVLVRQEKQ
jgi:hypothetical protein